MPLLNFEPSMDYFEYEFEVLLDDIDTQLNRPTARAYYNRLRVLALLGITATALLLTIPYTIYNGCAPLCQGYF